MESLSLAELIGQLGFPIVVAIYLLVDRLVVIRSLIREFRELRVTVQALLRYLETHHG